MLKTLTLASLLLIFATAAQAENLAFVGRTQNTADAPYTSITLSTPAGIQSGDMMLVFVASWNSTPTAPSGWTSLGSRSNFMYDIGAAFMKVWQTGDPTSYTFGNVNWSKAIMRVYRGVTGVDSSNFAVSGVRASSLTIPALPATTAADDAYIAFFVSDDAQPISGPSDLADQMADQTQWGSFDGDKVILNHGTEPPAEAAVLSLGDTGDWIGFMITLVSQPANPANQAFVGRTQNSADAPNTSIAVSTPAGIRGGDVMLVFIASYDSTPTAPSGWTSLGSRRNSNYDVGAAFMKVWQSGNPTSYTFGNVNWPKAIMRVYRGVTTADSSELAGTTGGAASSLTLPALQATSVANEEYVGFFVQDGASQVINGPYDLSNQTTDQTQWASFDGDKVIAAARATSPAETASISASQDWVGLAITLGNNPVQASACTSSVCPYCTVNCTSNTISPPSGQTWYVTLDDEFSTDTPGGATNGVNAALWNGGNGAPSGQTFPGCGYFTMPPQDTGKCDSYFGNAYDGMTYPGSPYIGIMSGVGLAVQPYINQGSATPDNEMSLQNYGRFSQRFGYFEIRAKMPTDNNGEGDGLHSDLWLVPVQRMHFSGAGSDEVDISENQLSTSNVNRDTTNFVVWDTSGGNNYEAALTNYPSVSVGDLSSAFHTYAVYWRNDGNQGTFQLYFDGQAVGSPVTVQDTIWAGGGYIFPGWMQANPSSLFGAPAVDSFTSNNNPLIIQYVRIWQSH